MYIFLFMITFDGSVGDGTKSAITIYVLKYFAVGFVPTDYLQVSFLWFVNCNFVKVFKNEKNINIENYLEVA